MSGLTEIRDIEKKTLIRTLGGHSSRVGAVSLAGNYLITGSRDHSINFYDLRCDNNNNNNTKKYISHT